MIRFIDYNIISTDLKEGFTVPEIVHPRCRAIKNEEKGSNIKTTGKEGNLQ